MQENEFEKQIKETVEDLRVLPSESVWENIKKHLIKRKRRVLPFFLLFATIALGGGFLVYSFEGKNHSQVNKSNITNTNSSSNQPILKDKQKENIQQKQLATQEQILNQTLPKNKINTSTSQTVSIIKPPSKEEIVYSNSNRKIKITENEMSNNNSGNSLADANSNATTINPTLAQTNNDQQKLNTFSNTNSDTLSKSSNDSTVQKVNPTNQAFTMSHKKSTTSKNNKEGKWKFGITAMYGMSDVSSFANFKSEKSSSNYNLNSAVSQGIASPLLVERPFNSSEAYKFGIAVQRKLFKHSVLNTGINYTHISAKSVIATSTTSSLVLVPAAYQNNFTLNYYQLGTEEIFKSDYNFIEVPLTFQSNIFRIKTFSLAYNVGPSIRKLIASKPLIYNDNNGTFSKDENLLKHTQVQLLAGLAFQLQLKNKSVLSLSPQFEYSLSKYAQNNNFHYFDYGLQATWLLGKK